MLILHNIRSAQNVGALFRTADAAGITRIYLSAITPQPIDRFGRQRTDIAKTALGAEQSVQWESYNDIHLLLKTLKQEGVHIVAIEQSKSAVDYKTVPLQESIVFILGNEVEGLPQAVLDKSDVVAMIPMLGIKESLNVSVAGGIALFRMLGI